MLATASKIEREGERVPGTVGESADKFSKRNQGEASVWGMTKAKMDVSAAKLFARLWELNTYRLKAEHKDVNGDLPRAVWENLDDTRSLQCTTCVKFPHGVSNRYFECWITWEARTLEDGSKEYVIVFVPMSDYVGTHHNLKGTDGMIKGLSKGVQVVKELTENTCVWTKVQVRVCNE